jgi:hypothetical protein
MNPEITNLAERLRAKITIKESNQNIKTAKQVMQKTTTHPGAFTPAEREIIRANKGSIQPVLRARREAMAAAAKAAKPPSPSKPVAAAPAKVSTPAPVAKSPAPAAKAPASNLTGHARVSAAFAKASPAPSKPGENIKLISAADFSGPRLKMTRDEFAKLSPSEKSRFAREGGKLV